MLPRWTCLVASLVGFAGPLVAQDVKDPFRFVPSQAEAVARIDHPRELLEAIEANEHFLQARRLAGVRDFYASTNFHRLYQLIRYFEKQLGKSKAEILDEISAGGIVLAGKFSQPGGALLVMQARDEARLRRFVEVGLDLLGKELERQESKDRIVRAKHDGFDVGKLGPKLSFAIADAALLIASEEHVLHAALATLKNAEQKSVLHLAPFKEARAKAPAQTLAWAWLHLEAIREHNPKFKSGLDASSMDPAQMLLFGGLTNLLKRSPCVSFAATRDGGTYRFAVTMPRGREGMNALSHMLLPKDGNGTLSPLAPPHTIASISYFLDLGQFFDKRVEILGEKNAKGLGDADKNLGKVLGGIKLSKLLNAMGTHHRIVIAQPKERPYKIRPGTPLPAFALVVDMRAPSFAKDMNAILRSAALLATFKYGLKLNEEQHAGCDLVSYTLSETKKVDGDPTNVRFNFSPSYVKVGNQFVVSSTSELARDLIDVLKAEKATKASPGTMRTQVRAAGFADVIRANEAAVLTQLILSTALAPDTAKTELSAIIRFVESLGSLRFEQTYGANDFRYEILWQAKKK